MITTTSEECEFIKKLESGQGTRVNLVKSRQTKTKYVFKRVYCDTPEKHQKFHREYLLHSRVSGHPKIANISSHWTDEGKEKGFLVEYLPGGDLFEELMRRNTFSEKETKKIIQQLLDAMIYVHSKDIVHRDLKLENVVLQDNQDVSTIKLIDFGLAKEDDGRNALFGICGTDGYMAPEIYSLKQYGKAVDMWALGVMTYTLLCGTLPFGNNLQDCEHTVQYGPTFDEDSWRSISFQAKDFITKLLKINPSLRLTAREALNHSWLGTLTTPLSPQTAAVLIPVASKNMKKRKFEDNNEEVRYDKLEINLKKRRFMTVTGS